MSPEELALSVEDAKSSLLDWGVDADAELHEQIHALTEGVRVGARKTVPWAVGGAAALGLLAMLFRRHAPRGRSPRAGGWLGLGLRLAFQLWPIVSAILRCRERDHG